MADVIGCPRGDDHPYFRQEPRDYHIHPRHDGTNTSSLSSSICIAVFYVVARWLFDDRCHAAY